MNYIEQFMKDNDIKIDEEFYIFDVDNRLGKSLEPTFYFDEGLYLEEKVGDYHSACSVHLRELMTGEYRIEKIPHKPKSVWDLKDGDDYYYIDMCGNVDITTFGISGCWADKKMIEIGNAFLTEKEAELEVERRKCEAVLLKYGTRDFMSLGNFSVNKYYIMYDNTIENVYVACCNFMQRQGSIYFKTEELAQKAIDEVTDERLKKYVFNVKE